MDDWESQVNTLVAPLPPQAEPQAPPQPDQGQLAKQAVPLDTGEGHSDVGWQDQVNALTDPEYQHKQLAAYRERVKGNEEPWVERFGKNSMPFMPTGIAVDRAYKTAKARFDQGAAGDSDTRMIAEYEQQRQEESQRGVIGKTADVASKIPAMLAEGYVAGASMPVAKGALGYIASKLASTPLMPSLYAEEASQRSVQQGGEVYSPKNLAPAVAMGAIQNVILGSAGKLSSGIPNAVGRFAAGVGIGKVEMELGHVAGGLADEFLPEAYQTHTKYGLLGDLKNGRFGEAAQKAAVDVLTLAAFQAMHGNHSEAKKTVEDAAKVLDGQADKVAPIADAAKVLQDYISEKMEAAGGPKQGDAETKQAVKDLTGNDEGPVPDPIALQDQLDQAKKEAYNAPGVKRFATKAAMDAYANETGLKGSKSSTSVTINGERKEVHEFQPYITGIDKAESAKTAPGGAERRAPVLPGREPGAYADVPEHARTEFESLTDLRNKAFADKDDTTVAALKQPIADLLLAHPDLRERSVMAKPRKATGVQDEGPQDPAARAEALANQYTRAQDSLKAADAEVAALKKPYETPAYKEAVRQRDEWSKRVGDLLQKHNDALNAQEPTKTAAPSPPEAEVGQTGAVTASEAPKQAAITSPYLERMRAKQAASKVQTPSQTAQAPREAREFAEYQPPTDHERFGLSKVESYAYDAIQSGKQVKDIVTENTEGLNSKQAVHQAALRASKKLGNLDPETGKPKSATRMLAERSLEKAGFNEDGTARVPVADSKEAVNNLMEEMANQGTYMTEGEAREQLRRSADYTHAKEEANSNLWTEYLEGLKNDAEYQRLTPEQLAAFDKHLAAKAAAGEDPPANEGKKYQARQRKRAKSEAKQSASGGGNSEGVRQGAEQRGGDEQSGQGTPASDAGSVQGSASRERSPASAAGPAGSDETGPGTTGDKLRSGVLADLANAKPRNLNPESKESFSGSLEAGQVPIWELVDKYGPEVKKELWDMRREGKVRLVAAGESLASASEGHGVSLEKLKAGSIEGQGEMFLLAEAKDQPESPGDKLKEQHEQVKQVAVQEANQALKQEGLAGATPAEIGRSDRQARERVAAEIGVAPEELDRLAEQRSNPADQPAAGPAGAAGSGPKPGTPGGRNGLSVPDAQANQQANAKTLDAHFKEFVKGEEGTLNLNEMKARFGLAVRNAHDALAKVAGYTMPNIKRLSENAGNAVYRLAAVKGDVEKQSQIYPDRVFGRKSTDAQERLVYSTMLEMRFREAKNNHLRDAAADMADARKAGAVGDIDAFNAYHKSAAAHLQAANDTSSTIGMKNSPLLTAADYTAALADPYVKGAIARYKSDYVPSKESTFRDSQGMNATDPINSRTQIKDMPIRAIPLDANGDPMAGGKGGVGEGNLGNVKARKNPASYQATLAEDAYELNGRKVMQADIASGVPLAAKAVAYRVSEAEGVGEWRAPGDKGPNGDGTLANGREARLVEDVNPPKNTQAAAAGERNFYYDEEGYAEFRAALAVDQPMAFTGPIATLMHLPGVAALASSVEMVSHGANLAGGMFHRADFRDIIKKPMDFFTNMHGFLTSEPSYQDKILEMAKLGRIKSGAERGGLLSPNWLIDLIGDKAGPVWKKYDPTQVAGKFLHAYDEIVRATLSDGYDRAAARGHFEGSESDKTNFIQSLAGNYNRGAMSSFIKFLKDSELQPFATPAAGMTLRSIRNLVGGGPGTTKTLMSDAHMRASVIAQLIALPAAGMLSNYLTTGQAMPDGIPYGALYTGDDEKGQKRYFDLLQLVGLKRGLNALGILPYAEAQRQGHSQAESVDRGVMGSVHALLHTVFGPGPNFAWTAATGKDYFGKQVSKSADKEEGETQFGQNVKTASLRANPIISALTGADEPNKEPTGREKAMKMLGPLGEKTAYPQQHPDVNLFREALNHDLDTFKENATSQKKEGLKAKEPRGLVVLNAANKRISDLERAYNNPSVPPETKQKIREAQGIIAKSALAQRKAILEATKAK